MSGLHRLPCLFGAAFVFVACGGESGSPLDDGSSEANVVGVEDLTALENELGLEKDVKGPQGFSRDVTKGACFKQGQAQKPKWEFRRYKNGAVFFTKATQSAHGSSRPVTCLDLDVTDVGTFALDRFLVDAVVRYDLGHMQGVDEAMGGKRAYDFDRGVLFGHSRSFDCGAFDLTDDTVASFSAWLAAGVAENKACRQGGGSATECEDKAVRACEAAAAKVNPNPPLHERVIDGEWELEGIRLKNDSDKVIDPVVANVVARYALKKATSANVFNMDEDPIGRVLDVAKGDQGWIHVRYSRLDVHLFRDAHKELVVITPKSSDANIQVSAIVACEQPANGNGFDCEMPGKPLAP